MKKVVEKSYVLNLEGRDLIMYVPIKTIKKTYKYFGPKDENKGEVKVEKFYRKIMYGSGEVSSGILEEMIEEIIPESTLRSYNILDLGELKEVVENEDAEEIFLRGTIKF
ncbi:hypothetical protein [Propionigenium maris]|uniref:hypothetical protein n=1 Tax=Propionigenium maris TaxID=45622 RepID=UPI002493B705|nr:hypothetical protein [Propionigenium maris]